MDSNKVLAWLLSLFTLLHLNLASTPTPRSSSQVAALLSTQDLKAEAAAAWRPSQTSNRKLMQSSSLGEMLNGLVRAGDVPGVKRLLNEGADPNFVLSSSGLTPLAIAIQQDYEEILKILIDAGADDSAGLVATIGALHLAAFLGSLDVVQVLLDAGYQSNSLNRGGLAPLHYASLEGLVNMGTLLLDKGATVDSISGTRRTPLVYAVWKNHLGMATMLISRGADVNFPSGEDGRTPLFFAARVNSGILTKKLLDNGAEINAQTQEGLTPLAVASLLGARVAMEVLVLNGADTSIEVNGSTPKEILCSCVLVRGSADLCSFDECSRPERMLALLE